MDEKNGYPHLPPINQGYPPPVGAQPGNGYPGYPTPGNGYPGPPEYVEQAFPVQPSYPPPPMGIQTHGMQPYGMPQPMGNPYTISTGYPPVMQQPMHMNMNDGLYLENAPPPQPVPNSDPSIALEYLKNVSSLQIRQKIEILELVSTMETANKYVIYNEQGQPVLNATEISECCMRQCCGPQRAMELRITDLYHNEIIHLQRPLKCQSFCFPCCLQSMEITSPPGTIIGTIDQKWSLWPKFDIFNAVGEFNLRIEGPFCTCSCTCSDVVFQILTHNGLEIGTIKKKWSGYEMEVMSKADTFVVTFPQDLDVQSKISLIGAVFLLDMMYFETPKTNNQRHH